ncbi:c-type cytochrome [Jiella pacifica]|uniref:Cytochrome c n=1 Tax=Jiella pacifica TaxID=2696469 RepID=A0A6N9SWD1_9HYPH|nr:cytochrome c [Jiella pacifica]NDW03390.1 cytochrome c [Jiella pacifica]
MSAVPRLASAVLAVLAPALLSACEQQSMETQPKLKTYSTAAAFPDNAVAREIPFGTVSRNEPARIAALADRPPVDEALLRRGREQYEIYCTPCHGLAGHGDGIIVQRGFPQPPSYMEPRLLSADSQHFVDVITHGWGVMYPYAARVEPRDRWAIAAYIRALQVSQTGAPRDVAAAIPANGAQGTPEAGDDDAPSSNREGAR